MIDRSRDQDDNSRLKEVVQDLQKELSTSKEENFELYKKISSLEDAIQSKDTQIRRLTANIEMLKTDVNALKSVKKSDKEKHLHRKSELAKGARILKSGIDSLPLLMTELVEILKCASTNTKTEFQTIVIQLASRFKFKEISSSLDALQSSDKSPSKPAHFIQEYDEYWPLRPIFDSFSHFQARNDKNHLRGGIGQNPQETRNEEAANLDCSLDLPNEASLELMLPADREDLLGTAEAYLLLKQFGLGSQAGAQSGSTSIPVVIPNSARCDHQCSQRILEARRMDSTRNSPKTSPSQGSNIYARKAKEK